MGRRPKDGAARPALPSEVEAVAGLAREARHEAQNYRGGDRWMATDAAAEPLAGHFGALIADPEAVVMAGLWEDAVVGYGWACRVLRQDGSLIVRIEELFVTPGARSIGVGESLFNALRTWAHEQGAVAIDAFVLPGHREAKNFFEGFKMTAHALIVHTRLDADAHA